MLVLNVFKIVWAAMEQKTIHYVKAHDRVGMVYYVSAKSDKTHNEMKA